ncbi:zf-HC2 domain-containing protein [Curtobacterium flaccumfaciens pv. flaccumfaciens]|uniref:anti-sigma factor n=1 Tax=Curtobacterium flaccumfaciens TaxID=2035 RepID=UPI00217D29A7|nr:zf-HC2 domain-containing protein [Curtobacterium flaccumfaciens]MCS6548371.1 zf-HC2 domain-containing protein [Curtobacterium flaccumfaciens pv. flaccumfaciens]
MSDDKYAEWDAAYVLGSLPASERLEYERHLETCDRCAAAVAELVGLPGLLGKLPADQAIEIAEPDGRPDTRSESDLASVAHRVRHRRRRRRVWVAATAGLAVVAAVLGGLAVGAAGERTTVQAGAAPTAAATADRYDMTGVQGLDVQLAISGEQWGTRFDWGCSYGGKEWSPDGSILYDLVVVRTDGSTQTVGSWTAAGADARGLSASTDIPRDEIESVQVRLRGERGALAVVTL